MLETINPMVSIIVPVYNAEKYLNECIDSILAQTFSDFELICVDDGSTDSSLEILEQYKSEDSRVQVYVQKNMHAGIARNEGMKKSNGKYILFLDADDFFEKTLLEKTVASAEKHNSDLVLFSADYYNHVEKLFEKASWELNLELLPEKKVFNIYDIPEKASRITGTAPWNKLIKKTLLTDNDLKFPDLKNSEDLSFVFMVLVLAKRITCVKDVLIHIRRGHGTNLESNKDMNAMEFYKGLLLIKDMLQRLELYEKLKEVFIGFAIAAYDYQISTLKNFETKIEVMKFFLDEGLCSLDESAYHYEKIIVDWIMTIEKEKYWLKNQFVNYKVRSEELQNYIEEVLLGKQWLEEQCSNYETEMKNKEAYITDLLSAKGWLEQQSNEHEKYIADLLNTKQWLENQNEIKEEELAQKSVIIEVLEQKNSELKSENAKIKYYLKLLKEDKLIQKIIKLKNIKCSEG